MNRQRLDSPLVYVGAHNVYYVKLPVKVLYFTNLLTFPDTSLVRNNILFNHLD